MKFSALAAPIAAALAALLSGRGAEELSCLSLCRLFSCQLLRGWMFPGIWLDPIKVDLN